MLGKGNNWFPICTTVVLEWWIPIAGAICLYSLLKRWQRRQGSYSIWAPRCSITSTHRERFPRTYVTAKEALVCHQYHFERGCPIIYYCEDALICTTITKTLQSFCIRSGTTLGRKWSISRNDPWGATYGNQSLDHLVWQKNHQSYPLKLGTGALADRHISNIVSQ